MRRYQPRGVAVPIDIPQGGVALCIPVDGQQLKKLARQIVTLEYLQDGKGKYVFNPEGKPVPRFEQNDEALIDEAMRRVPKIKSVEIPVYRRTDDGEFELQYEGEGEERKPISVVTDVDDTEAIVTAGDYSDTKRNIKRNILSEIVEVEVTVTLPSTDAATDSARSDAGSDGPAAPRTVSRKVEQLVAEYLIEQCATLGRAQREEQRKN